MRFALDPALAGLVGPGEPPLALDKQSWAPTGWPTGGGRLLPGAGLMNVCLIWLDAAIIPGGPETNGALML